MWVLVDPSSLTTRTGLDFSKSSIKLVLADTVALAIAALAAVEQKAILPTLASHP